MKSRKILSMTAALTLAVSMLTGSIVYADSISEEKRNLMIAAGEIPPGNAPDEDSVKIKREQAIEIAKKLLASEAVSPVSGQYEPGNAYLNPKWGSNSSSWTIDLYRPVSNGGNANIVVDADSGEVIGFNCWEGYDNQKNFVATITRAEAAEKAKEFLKSHLKLEISDLELQQDTSFMYNKRWGGIKEQIIYNFSFTRKVNGVSFPNSNIFVGIDGTNGKIRSFNYNNVKMDSLKFPSPEGVMAPEKAMEKFKESMGLSLQFVTTYGEPKPYGPSNPNIILAYVPSPNVNMLDAFTGVPLNYDGTPVSAPEKGGQQQENIVPMKPDAKLESRHISENEAVDMAENFKEQVEEILGESLENESSPYKSSSKYFDNQNEIWNFNWFKNTQTGGINTNISINGKTGHIVNMGLSKYDYNNMPQKEIDPVSGIPKESRQPVEEKVNWNQGKEKADALIQRLLPEQYGFFADLNTKSPDYSNEQYKYAREHSYNFGRVVSGLRFRENNMSVSVDRQTGNIINFYFNWSDLEFPSAGEIISKEEAANKFLSELEAKLTYHISLLYQKDGTAKYEETPRLVYTFNNKGFQIPGVILDVKKGKLVDWSGREIAFGTDDNKEESFSNHWAGRSIQLLMEQGIIDAGITDFDGALSRMDVIKMLVQTKGYNYYFDPRIQPVAVFTDVSKEDDNFTYVDSALRYKIITEASGEFKGNEKITKGEFIKLLVNLIGYGDIAQYQDIYKVTGLKNVSADLTGYAAIGQVLVILPVRDGGTFDATEEVSLAESAAALYKALNFMK